MLFAATLLSVALDSHVRTSDAFLAEVLARSLRESETIRRLVEIVDASNVFVYLAVGMCPRPAVACLMMAGGAGGVRYVRINFVRPEGLGRSGWWTTAELSSQIAHELQHAAEIAGWPEVIDGASMQAAYRRRGVDRSAPHLDTDAAVEAGAATHLELSRRKR